MNVNDTRGELASTVDDASDGTFGRLLRHVASVPGGGPSAVGKTIGRYRITGELGRGGMGVVYEATDLQLQRSVALKLLPGELVAPERRELFLGEVVVTAGLEHPGIVPVYDAGETPGGELFYTMRKVSGRTLAALIAETPVPSDRLALLPHLIACANAVAYAHDLGIIHRDLKPANVIVGAFGETVVVDWGIARRVTADAPASGSGVERLGTPAYMAPEQTAGAALSPRTDVYACGAMLYHLLDGRPPPRAPDLDARGDLPAELVAVMRKAMAPAPEERYPSLRELAEELRRFQAGQLVGAHRYSLRNLLWRWLVRNRARVIVAGVIVAVLAANGLASVRAIVRSRDEALDARRVAVTAQAGAETRNRELLLLHARSEVPHDPTAALAWLKRSAHAPGDAADERQIAADAWARGPARHVIAGPAAFRAVAVSSNARVVAAELADRILWWDDLARPPHVLPAVDGHGGALVIAADGRTLVSTDSARTTRIWDLAAGTEHALDVRAKHADIAPTGDALLLSHPFDRPRWFRLPELTELALPGDTEVAALAAHGAVAARASSVDVLDRAGHLVRSYPRPARRAAAVIGAPDGRWIGVATPSGIELLERATGRWHLFSTGPTGPEVLLFSPDGHWAAACSISSGLWLVDLTSMTPSALTSTERCFTSMAFSADATTLFTVGYDDSVHGWDVATGRSRALRGQHGSLADIAISPDGTWLAATGQDATVRLFETDAHVVLRHGAVTVSPIAASGAMLVRDRIAATFGVRPVRGPEELLARVDYAEIPPAAALGALSSDGRVACFLDSTGAVVVVDRVTGARSSFGPYPDGKLSAVDLSPSGARLALATDLGVVRVVEVATGTSRVLGRHDQQVQIARYAPDETGLATAGRDRTVRIWERAGGTTVIRGRTDRIWDVAFSPDGSWLASASADGTVRRFRRDGGALAVLDAHAGPVLSVDVAPSGRELIAGGIDGALRRWSVDTGQGIVLRWLPGASWNGRYSADGTLFSATYRGGSIVLDPTVPDLREVRLDAWLDATTTAIVDDGGHITGAGAPAR